jgi:hypothetical protein
VGILCGRRQPNELVADKREAHEVYGRGERLRVELVVVVDREDIGAQATQLLNMLFLREGPKQLSARPPCSTPAQDGTFDMY